MEVTPQVATSSLFLIILVAPILTLLLSAILLWRYRRAVMRAMVAPADFGGSGAPTPVHRESSLSQAETGGNHIDPALYETAMRAPWHVAARYIVAGLAFALVFALTARFVYPLRVDMPGLLIGVWIYAWPAAFAVPLIIPGPIRWWIMCIVAYCVSFLPIGVWAAAVPDMPAYQFGGIVLSARSSLTPWGIMRLWLVVNGVPTLLMLCCFNRRVLAVAPLMLAAVTTAVSGTWIALFALFTPAGVDFAVLLSVFFAVHVYWIVWATVIFSLLGFSSLAWVLARWIARAYRRRKLSDQSLLLDALWLFFASFYGMWLVLGGLAWAAVAPAAFLSYKLVLRIARKIPSLTSTATRGLTFLRVFSLGRRSVALLNRVASHWRYIGSVQMITGPDVALSSVQPHQFLDFLSGKLASHFVRDQTSLDRSLAQRDQIRDADGRFPINNFFCHANTWQLALPRLVEQGEVVLMDLRSFSAMKAGCVHELRFLIQSVPLDRCVLIVDETTDQNFLQRTLNEAWEHLPAGSPNRDRSLGEAPLHHFEPGAAAVRGLVRRLCDAGTWSFGREASGH
jgi:hypothetical protein